VGLSRRELLVLGASVPLAVALRAGSVRADNTPNLSAIREWVRAGIARDASGAVVGVFDLDVRLSGEVLLQATKADPLPDGYAPGDVVSATGNGIPAAGRQLIRAVIVQDTRALVQDAANAGLNLYVGSGFRSQAYQVDVFAAQVARWGDEETANRYSARPGHSQHQLGTTIDFTNDFRTFRASEAPLWMRENAHRFGFVLPYTAAASARTGYIDEPWHGRWVGRALANQLHSAGYHDWTEVDADDVVAMVRSEAALDA
jgi:D-alanyl-D-alanine carboxypeptidase